MGNLGIEYVTEELLEEEKSDIENELKPQKFSDEL